MRIQYYYHCEHGRDMLYALYNGTLFVLMGYGWVPSIVDIEYAPEYFQSVHLYQVRSLFPELKQHKLKCKSLK